MLKVTVVEISCLMRSIVPDRLTFVGYNVLLKAYADPSEATREYAYILQFEVIGSNNVDTSIIVSA
jgi:hypothetical protein